MVQSFDAFEYVEHLRRQWRIIAVACVLAVLIAVGVSLLLPKRYTATARIVIEPPGGSDARLATAISTMYLESLKAYEFIAGGDTLFEQAAQRFHLLEPGSSQSIESLKRRVLKVSKLRDTRILEISATWTDPKLAQALAKYIADQSVALSRGENLASDRDFVEQAENQAAEAKRHLDQVQAAEAGLASEAPLAALQSEIDSSGELQSKLRQQLVETETDVVQYQQQTPADGQFAAEQLLSARGRVELLQRRTHELDREIQEKSALLSSRTAKREALQAELKVAQSAYQTVVTRLQEYRAAAGSHAEQLRVIDPGIIPQQPTFPNIPLNAAAALLLALVSSIVYLSITFVYRRRPAGLERTPSRGMRG
jgi:succinoglycan biosynthesis transport protein ExoP